jgi:very-short-patch-repair endonuclease
MGVRGWPEVFRGSEAVAAGLVTWGRLRGPRFVRLFPDIYAAAGDRPPDLKLRSRAAALLVEGRGVASGYSAAELLGASCGPAGAPAEVTLFRGRQRAHPGLLVHRDRVAPGELARVGGHRVTGPMRTAWDLARRLDLVEGVVAVDRLANVHRFNPDLLLNFLVHYRGARGNERVTEVLAHAARYSGSPMESRLRMLLAGAGLPRPRVQWVVPDPVARTAVWLDLAYPEAMIGIEYEGEEHTTPEGVLRDAGRYTRLVDQGWRIYRYTKYEIYGEQQRIVDQITRGLARSNGTPSQFAAQ